MLKYRRETHFWSHRSQGQSQYSTSASLFLSFKLPAHFELSIPYFVFSLCRISGVINDCSRVCSAGRANFAGFERNKVSRVIPFLPRMAGFTWVLNLSRRSGGYVESRSKNGSMAKGVFLNPAVRNVLLKSLLRYLLLMSGAFRPIIFLMVICGVKQGYLIIVPLDLFAGQFCPRELHT